MAIKHFNSVYGFSVGEEPVYVIDSNRDVVAGNITTSGSLNVRTTGNSNVLIVGSSSANLTGNLSVSGWANVTGNITIDGAVTSVDHVDYDTANVGNIVSSVGRTVWNDGDGTLDLGLKGGNVVLQIGQEEVLRVYNGTGNTLTSGQVVRVIGAQGNRPSVELARADAESTSINTIGMVTETIANDSEGFVTISGIVRGLDTTAFSGGEQLYLSPTVAGAYTATKPSAPNHVVVVGWVTRVHASVGAIFVKIDNGYELDELHNVSIANATSGQTLVYSNSNVWVNQNLEYDTIANAPSYTAYSGLTQKSLRVGNANLSFTPTIETGYVAAANYVGTYSGFTIQNRNGGNTSSTNMYFAIDSSTETTDYAVFGLNSSNYNFGSDTVDGAKKSFYFGVSNGDISLIPNFYDGGNIHLSYSGMTKAISILDSGAISTATTFSANTGNFTFTPGTSGQVLVSGGASAAVSWSNNVPHANTANTANSVAGANVTGTVANATYATSAGTVTTAAQPNITSVGTLTSLTVSGNVSAGNVSGGNLVTANYISGTLTTAAQGNITSVGNLTSLVVSGNMTVADNLTVSGTTTSVNVTSLNVSDTIIEMGGLSNGSPLTTNDGKDRGALMHYYTTAAVDAFMGWDNGNGEFAFGSNVTVSNSVVTFNTLGNIRASVYIGNGSGLTALAGANVTGTVANANYSSYSNVASTANSVAGANVTGQVSYAATANSVAAANVSGTVANANYSAYAGIITTAAQPNITSVGTLTALSVTGNVSAGNVSGGNLVTANYVTGTLTTAAQPNITSVGTLTSLSITGNVTAGNVSGGNLVTANYVTGTLTTAAQPNITSVGTLSSLSVTANISGGNLSISGKSNLGAVGNVIITGGSNLQLLQTDGAGNLSFVNPFTTWSSNTTWTLGATTTAPSFATSNTRRIMWREDRKILYIRGFYNASSSSGTANGSGEYLLTIPSGYTIDTTLTGTNGIGVKYGMSVGRVYIDDASGLFAFIGDGIVLVYDSTRVKFVTPYYGSSTGASAIVGSGYFNLVQDRYYMTFDIALPIT